MDPKRVVSKLAAGTTPLEKGSGGAPALTQSDAAACCSGLSDSQYELLTAKWARYEGVLPRLAYRLMSEVTCDMAVREKWEIPRGRLYMRKMTLLALAEVLDPQICRRCKGTQFIGHRTCPSCRGTGHRRLHGAQRARIIGCDKSRWYRVWAPRYEAVYRQIADLEISGLASIRRQMLERVARPHEKAYFSV